MTSQERRISNMVRYWVYLDELREGRSYFSLPTMMSITAAMSALENFVG